jgi:hypothetical protein
LVPTGCAGKVKEVGERLTSGVAMPVPVRVTVCVAVLALSVMVKEPLREPVAVGVKVTLRVQLALAARLEPQVLVWEKSPLFVPAMVTLVMLSVALPVLVSVMGAAGLVVPITWLPKSYDDGERATKGVGERLNLVTKAS